MRKRDCEALASDYQRYSRDYYASARRCMKHDLKMACHLQKVASGMHDSGVEFRERAIERGEVLTAAQEEAIIRKYECNQSGYYNLMEFMDEAKPMGGCDGAVTVKWCGMWLCIERDGYTHS